MAVAAVAAAMATPVGAQDFGTQCTVASNGLTVCAMSEATFLSNVISLSVDNVQGPAGDFTTNGAAHKITGVALYYQGSGLGGATMTLGPSGWTDGAHSSFFGAGNGNSPGAGYSLFAAAQVNQSLGGIIGCDAAGSPAATSTCGANPNAFFQFTLNSGSTLPSQFYLAFRSQSVGPDGEGSAKCYPTNVAGSAHSCTTDFTTTPEPASLALLGLGLAGLGGFGTLRRRRSSASA